MKIRKARLADVPEILRLWKELFRYHKKFKSVQPFVKMRPDAPKIMDRYIRRSIRSRYSLVLVAEEGKLAGYCITHIKKNIPVYSESKLGYICDIYVQKKNRGKGISSGFKKEVVAWLKKNKIKQMEIAIWWGNESARKVYRKWGLREFDLRLRKRL
ncbi:MAG: GNAT family N-acetyltransferase [Candidatus Aenigmatarchaeota archaeon]